MIRIDMRTGEEIPDEEKPPKVDIIILPVGNLHDLVSQVCIPDDREGHA